MDKQLNSAVLIALSSVLYGTIGYFGTNLFQAGLSVRNLLFWRFASAAILLLPFLLLKAKRLIPKREHGFAILIALTLGVLCYGVGTELYFKASFMIGTGLAMVLFFTYPLLIVAYSSIRERRLPNRATVIALGLISLGCSMIGSGGVLHENWLGIGLAVISGMGYGAYILVSKSRLTVLDPVLSTFVICFGCALWFLVELFLVGESIYSLQTKDIGLNIFLFGLLGTVLPVLFLLKGVANISATKTAILSVLEPVTVLWVGVTVLGEPVTAIQIVGAVVILTSALVVQTSRD